MAGMVSLSVLEACPRAPNESSGVDAEAPRSSDRVRALARDYYDVVWRSLRRFGVPESAVDDAMQQVLCILVRRLDEVAIGKEKTFLIGVALRVAQNARRAIARRPEIANDEAIASLAAGGASPEELLDARRARALLDELLEELPLELRSVFVLYEIEEMTMIEIASALEVPQGTVASRLRRARALFADLAHAAQERAAEQGGAR